MSGKFKVWDSDLKRWKKTIDRDAQEYYFMINSEGTLMQRFNSFPSQNESHIDFAMSRYTPIFSTGKTDKNGVELFDGDIFEYNNDIESGKAVIEMTDGSFIARWIKQKTPKPSIWTLMYYLGCSAELEKIGNKLENPELMETK